MSQNTNYIEIDSSSRDRSVQKINGSDTCGPANFKIITGVNRTFKGGKQNSVDPLSDQVEIIKWRSSEFMLDTAAASSQGIRLKPFNKTLPDSADYSVSGTDRLILTSVTDLKSSVGIGGLQPHKNYYWGATINVDTPTQSTRIIGYEYLGSDKCILRVESPITIEETSVLQIVDPTSDHDSSVTIRDDAFIFVPCGPPSFSLVGKYLEADVASGSRKSFLITSHDTHRNMIKIKGDDLTTSNKIIDASNMVIRETLPRILSNQLLNFLNAFTMNSYRGAKDIFGFDSGTDISRIQEGDFIEISNDTARGTAVVSGATNTKFIITGTSWAESSEDDAYVGCTVRLVMNDTLAPNLYTAEDRIVSSYDGTTRIITVSEEFDNNISTYDVLKFIMFFPTEARKIETLLNLNIGTYDDLGSIPAGNQYVNLLNYTSAPGSKSADKNYDLTAAKAALDKHYSTSNLTGHYISVDTGGGSYSYGYIVNHVVELYNDDTTITKLNYLEVNAAFGTTLAGLGGYPVGTVIIHGCKMSSPFTRNPFSRLSTSSKERYSVLTQTSDSHSYLYATNSQTRLFNTCENASSYLISLINIILPNKPLKSSKGGYITQYPYVYVKFDNLTSSAITSSFISNSKSALKTTACFKVLIDNIVDDEITKFVVLRAGEMSLEYRLNFYDDLRFTVYLPDGSIFETVEQDEVSPKQPNKDLQVTALFSITENC